MKEPAFESTVQKFWLQLQLSSAIKLKRSKPIDWPYLLYYFYLVYSILKICHWETGIGVEEFCRCIAIHQNDVIKVTTRVPQLAIFLFDVLKNDARRYPRIVSQKISVAK